MKGSAVFAGKARLEVRWNSPRWVTLEDELEKLFARYNLECADRGYNMVEGERVLVFRPCQEEGQTDGA